MKAISTVTGKDVHTFLEQWVQSVGCARFSGNFVFNRKRNVVEMELRQDFISKGSMKYVVSMNKRLHEICIEYEQKAP